MTYLCVDRNGEYIANNVPVRDFRDEWNGWEWDESGKSCTLISLPKGTIKKFIGREMTWEDDPICLEEFMYNNV